MHTNSEELPAILNKMLEDLGDPANHYMISASYFEYISPEDRELGKYHLAVVYLNQDAAWNLTLSQTSLELDVLLHPEDPNTKTRIRIPINEIWSVQISDGKTFTDSGRLFYSKEVFRGMLKVKND